VSPKLQWSCPEQNGWELSGPVSEKAGERSFGDNCNNARSLDGAVANRGSASGDPIG